MKSKADIVWTKQPGKRWIATVWREGERQAEEERISIQKTLNNSLLGLSNYHPIYSSLQAATLSQQNYNLLVSQLNYCASQNGNRCPYCGHPIPQNSISPFGILGLLMGI